MDLSHEVDAYIKESIESSLGLPVSARTLQLKILASEDERRRLQDQISALEDRLREKDRRLEQYRAEATMNAQGLRKCIEEREVMVAEYTTFVNHCAKLEKECTLYERDLEKITESCDELEKENGELRARLQENSAIMVLVTEVETLKKDKENLRINLNRAEEEVKVLFEENRALDDENKRLLRQLNREKHLQGSDQKYSTSASSKGKRKSSLKEDENATGRAIDFNAADTSRPPLSPLHHNSPDSRLHKAK